MNVFAQELKKPLPAGIPCSIGLHPWHLEDNDFEECMELLEQYAGSSQVLALGEAGLDRNIETPLNKQNDVFLEHIKLSEKHEKPLVVHCVKAYSDILGHRKAKAWKMPWLMHWFNENATIAKELTASGCYLSFGRSLLHPNGRNAEVFREVPLACVFFETDDAEVTIEAVYAKACEIKGIALNDLKAVVAANYGKVFV